MGSVQDKVFSLIHHRRAKHAYAWAKLDGKGHEKRGFVALQEALRSKTPKPQFRRHRSRFQNTPRQDQHGEEGAPNKGYWIWTDKAPEVSRPEERADKPRH
jgi:hypothetical protein